MLALSLEGTLHLNFHFKLDLALARTSEIFKIMEY